MSHNNMVANLRTCSRCQHKNQSNDVLCVKCGTRLPMLDTVPLSRAEISGDKLIDMQHGMKTIQQTRYPGALLLCVLENDQSTIIVDKQNIILGRTNPGSKPTPGDLTLFNAYALGVSRDHAQITFENGRYILQDLGSANGTWVNVWRLPAYEPYLLKNGDLICLGKLALTVSLTP